MEGTGGATHPFGIVPWAAGAGPRHAATLAQRNE